MIGGMQLCFPKWSILVPSCFPVWFGTLPSSFSSNRVMEHLPASSEHVEPVYVGPFANALSRTRRITICKSLHKERGRGQVCVGQIVTGSALDVVGMGM